MGRPVPAARGTEQARCQRRTAALVNPPPRIARDVPEPEARKLAYFGGERGTTITVSSVRSQDGKPQVIRTYTWPIHGHSSEGRSRFSSDRAGKEGSAVMRVVLLGTV